MASKITPTLMKRLDEIEKSKTKGAAAPTEVPREIRVIVEVADDVDMSELQAKGFKLNHKFENIQAVSGTLPADKHTVERFARELRLVNSVDYDGERQAFS
jgi:hypothetical protein